MTETATGFTIAGNAPNTNQGWSCPKCNRVNAPFISMCPCWQGGPAPNAPWNPAFPTYTTYCSNCGQLIYSYPHYCWYYNTNRPTWVTYNQKV